MDRRAVGFVARVLVAGLCTAGLAALHAQERVPEAYRSMVAGKSRAPVGRVAEPARGVGVVQYDPGLPADGTLSGPWGGPYPTSAFVGNRFDTRSGNPLSPGTITAVSFYQVGQGLYVTDWVLVAPPGGAVFYADPISPAPSTFVSVPLNVPITPPVIVGTDGRTLSGAPYNAGLLGYRRASTNSQGFHAVQRNFAGDNSNTVPSVNAMIRAHGNIVIPVELLEFEIY